MRKIACFRSDVIARHSVLPKQSRLYAGTPRLLRFVRNDGRAWLFIGLILSGFFKAHSETLSSAFFPWGKASTWVYDTLNKTKNDRFEMKVTMEGPWDDRETGAAGMIMTQRDKRGQMREFLLRNEKGIFIQKLGLSKALTPEVYTRFTPPVPRVIFPLEPGTHVHWEGRLKVRLLMDKPIIFDGDVVGWEDVDVPAGRFHCIKLHYHEKRGDEIIDENAWYAEGVGQVKYDGGQYVKELKSYEIKGM
ncbi:MAG: hypothetical protein WC859_09565 [Elusimicrobiota bacterium]